MRNNNKFYFSIAFWFQINEPYEMSVPVIYDCHLDSFMNNSCELVIIYFWYSVKYIVLYYLAFVSRLCFKKKCKKQHATWLPACTSFDNRIISVTSHKHDARPPFRAKTIPKVARQDYLTIEILMHITKSVK